MNFIPLNNLLADALKKAGIYRQVVSTLFIEEFQTIINRMFEHEISKKIRGLYIKDGILTVACLSPVIAQELKFREREILSKLNEGKNKTIVERIRYLM